jgi:hypothetical protein
VRGQLSSTSHCKVAACQGAFQASITSLRPLSSQSAIFRISSPSDLEQEFDRYVFFFKFFPSMAFTSYYWPQPTVFRAVYSEYSETNLRLIWGLAQCRALPITSSIGKAEPIHDIGECSSLGITFFIQWFQLLVVPSSSGETSPRGRSQNTVLEG